MAQKMENREAPPVVVTAQVVSGSFVTEANLTNVIPPSGVATATVPSTANHTGVWKYDVFGRCCSCESDCWMAWCCACFPLAQIAGKLQAAQSNVRSAGCLGPAYHETMKVYFFLLILGLILSIFAGNLVQSPTSFASLYLFIVACQARINTRRYHQIHADNCNDCCCSWWCLPCVITQLYECNHDSIHAFLL